MPVIPTKLCLPQKPFHFSSYQKTYKFQKIMSVHSRQSFHLQCHEEDNLLPEELSGDEDGEDHDESDLHEMHKTGFFPTSANIVKSIIGTGLISLPYAVSNLGYGLSAIFIVMGILINLYTSKLLMKAKNLSHHSNYMTILHHISNSKIFQFLCCLIILTNNVVIIQVLILKDSVKLLLDTYHPQSEDYFYTSKVFIVLLVGVIQIPLVLIKKIQKLKFVAYLGIAGILVFFISFIVYFVGVLLVRESHCSSEMVAFEPADGMTIVSMSSVFFYVFCFQHNQFAIFKGMQKPGDHQFGHTTIFALIVSGVIYYGLGTIGYCLFGSKINGSFLLQFSNQNTSEGLFLLMNCGFLVSVFFSIPFLFFAGRNNFIAMVKILLDCSCCKNQNKVENAQEANKEHKKDQMNNNQQQENQTEIKEKHKQDQSSMKVLHNQYQGNRQNSNHNEGSQSTQPEEQKCSVLYYACSLFLHFLNFLISILVDDITDVYNIQGAIAATAISIALPSFFYQYLIRNKQQEIKCNYYVAIVLLMLSFPYAITAIVANYV